jgi:hypothetical protein
MLLRFEQDVVALHPAAVHILAGTNDIAANWGAMPLETTERLIASMAELAQDNGIRVIIGSVPPVRDFPWRPGLNPGPAVVALNDWLRAYCASKGFVLRRLLCGAHRRQSRHAARVGGGRRASDARGLPDHEEH